MSRILPVEFTAEAADRIGLSMDVGTIHWGRSNSKSSYNESLPRIAAPGGDLYLNLGPMR